VNLETKSETIRQYLLGLGTDGELSAIDERLVADGDFYEEVLIVESELIDEYLSDELTDAERAGFENYFLVSPTRQKQLSFARSFHNYIGTKELELDSQIDSVEISDRTSEVPKPPPKERPWYWSFLPVQTPAVAYAVMLGVLLLVAGVSWWTLQNQSAEPPGPIYAVTITAGTTRGMEASARKIEIPAGTGTLEIRAQLGRESYQGYQAACIDENGSTIIRFENLQPKIEAGTQYLTVGIPARLLIPRIYSLKVSGRQPDGNLEDLPTYRFQILR
jgi:hypothetical protein